jgi:hypothetical protein
LHAPKVRNRGNRATGAAPFDVKPTREERAVELVVDGEFGSDLVADATARGDRLPEDLGAFKSILNAPLITFAVPNVSTEPSSFSKVTTTFAGSLSLSSEVAADAPNGRVVSDTTRTVEKILFSTLPFLADTREY